MKRLLAYLFIVLSLGLVLSLNSYAVQSYTVTVVNKKTFHNYVGVGTSKSSASRDAMKQCKKATKKNSNCLYKKEFDKYMKALKPSNNKKTTGSTDMLVEWVEMPKTKKEPSQMQKVKNIELKGKYLCIDDFLKEKNYLMVTQYSFGNDPNRDKKVKNNNDVCISQNLNPELFSELNNKRTYLKLYKYDALQIFKKYDYDYSFNYFGADTKTLLTKAEPSQTQKVIKIEQVKICLYNDENTIFINNKATGNCEYESGKGSKISYEKLLSKNPDMEICYRPNYKTVFAVKTIQRPGTYETQTSKNCNQVFEDAIVLNHLSDDNFSTFVKTKIAKAEPSQTQKTAKKDIKFCVIKVTPYYYSTLGDHKYKIRRFDNPYRTCKSNFIIDKNYKDELFYAYLVDTIGIVETKSFRTLEPIGNWKPKNPIKPKKKVKVAKVEEPKQDEFKPKKTNQDNEAPVIQIAEAITVDSQAYTLKGNVKDESQIYLTIDGRQVEVKKGKFELPGFIVDPSEGETLKIVAIDRWQNKSEKTINIKVKFKQTADVRSYEKPNPNNIRTKKDNDKIGIIIGIEKYQALNNLDAPYANRDANAFRAYATRALGIPNKNLKVLIDDKATRSGLLKSLKIWLPQMTRGKSKDIYIFFAGHGLASDDGKDLHILPQDGDPILLEDTALSRVEMFDLINKVSPKSVTMFFDTCYSGQTRDERMLVAGLRPVRIVADDQDTPNNFTIFTASNYDQTSGSINEAEHGIFSYYLMKGLEGNADANEDKKLTNGELIAYLKNNVSQEAFTQNRTQEPMFAGDPDKVLMNYR